MKTPNTRSRPNRWSPYATEPSSDTLSVDSSRARLVKADPGSPLELLLNATREAKIERTSDLDDGYKKSNLNQTRPEFIKTIMEDIYRDIHNSACADEALPVNDEEQSIRCFKSVFVVGKSKQ